MNFSQWECSCYPGPHFQLGWFNHLRLRIKFQQWLVSQLLFYSYTIIRVHQIMVNGFCHPRMPLNRNCSRIWIMDGSLLQYSYWLLWRDKAVSPKNMITYYKPRYKPTSGFKIFLRFVSTVFISISLDSNFSKVLMSYHVDVVNNI